MALGVLFLIVFVAIILFVFNKEYLLYYFVFLYPILPEYLAVSFSESLPLFTASRILLIIMIGALFNRRMVFKNIFKDKMFGKAFLVYFLCETAVALAHVSESASIKTYISVILENIIFFYVMTTQISTKRRFEGCMNALISASAVVFVMGVLETVTKFNVVSTFLDTGSRENMLISSYERYDSVRAAFSFGHAIALGLYCIALLPLIMHMINKEQRKQLYLLYMLGVACLIMTMSRGVIAVFGIVFCISMFKIGKKQRQTYLKVIGIGLFFGLLLILLSPNMFSIFRDTVLGTLNAFGGNFAISDSGGNEDAVFSRISQLSLLQQIAKHNYIFGGGTGYIFNNIVYVIAGNRQFRAKSIDIEYLAVFINRGIVGLIGCLGLYSSILLLSYKTFSKYKDSFCIAFFYSFLSIFLAYFTVAKLTTERILWMLIVMFISYKRIYLDCEES
ncbi:O-antigen ligase family protein [Butyrivibrio sp. AE3004]|uniref:O-antigen ligase family protein n=1 Tax=Butyrivibrio sp. AE3004 TaxID=1506994 RepID=UPI000494BD6C|nr:O-antigen ligase family protein [Butyrivibrio sp. AE3004]